MKQLPPGVTVTGFEPRSWNLWPLAHSAIQCQFYPIDYIFQPYNNSHLKGEQIQKFKIKY